MPLDICMLQQIYFARMYTPSPLHDGAGGTLPEDDSVSKLSEDFSSTENRDVTEIDEEINLGRFKASPQVTAAVASHRLRGAHRVT